jgi:phosphoglycolate phosphatase
VPKTVIFDFDGTIADTESLILEAYKEVSKWLKTPEVTPELSKRLKKMTAGQILKEFKPKWKLPLLIFAVRSILHKQTSKIKYFEGMEQVLKTLKKNYRLGILSSNSARLIQRFLKANGIEYFDFVVGERNLLGKGKRLLKLINKYNLDKHQTIYIGDELKDIAAAKTANIKVISVSWGLNDPKTLKEKNPEFFVQTPTELLNKINQTLV